MPYHFKEPTMEAYNGTSDLFDYMESFRSLILHQGMLDALMCKTFLTTFKKVARAWYTQLLPRLIHFFEEFNYWFTV